MCGCGQYTVALHSLANTYCWPRTTAVINIAARHARSCACTSVVVVPSLMSYRRRSTAHRVHLFFTVVPMTRSRAKPGPANVVRL